MAQTPLTPPSVFSFYSPLYRIPQTPLFGPEFQIYTPTESILRGNFLWEMISNPATDIHPNLSPFTAVAGTRQQLIDAWIRRCSTAACRRRCARAWPTRSSRSPTTTAACRRRFILTALSGLYAVQY